MNPPAPGRLTTMNVWPNCLVSTCASLRVNVSLLAPGAYGTTIVTGRLGQSSARASPGTAATVTATSAARTARRFPCVRSIVMVSTSCGPVSVRRSAPTSGRRRGVALFRVVKLERRRHGTLAVSAKHLPT
jgi:hypothetical protein